MGLPPGTLPYIYYTSSAYSLAWMGFLSYPIPSFSPLFWESKTSWDRNKKYRTAPTLLPRYNEWPGHPVTALHLKLGMKRPQKAMVTPYKTNPETPRRPLKQTEGKKEGRLRQFMALLFPLSLPPFPLLKYPFLVDFESSLCVLYFLFFLSEA